MDNLGAFYLDKPEPQKSCLLALREILLQADPNLTAEKKYGMPCFCWKSKALCYLWVEKKTEDPYILWVGGDKMDFPELEQGDRKRMKIQRFDPNADLPLEAIHRIFEAALNLLLERHPKLRSK